MKKTSVFSFMIVFMLSLTFAFTTQSAKAQAPPDDTSVVTVITETQTQDLSNAATIVDSLKVIAQEKMLSEETKAVINQAIAHIEDLPSKGSPLTAWLGWAVGLISIITGLVLYFVKPKKKE